MLDWFDEAALSNPEKIALVEQMVAHTKDVSKVKRLIDKVSED